MSLKSAQSLECKISGKITRFPRAPLSCCVDWHCAITRLYHMHSMFITNINYSMNCLLDQYIHVLVHMLLSIPYVYPSITITVVIVMHWPCTGYFISFPKCLYILDDDTNKHSNKFVWFCTKGWHCGSCNISLRQVFWFLCLCCS